MSNRMLNVHHQNNEKKISNKKIILEIIVLSLLIFILIIFCIWGWQYYKEKKDFKSFNLAELKKHELIRI